MITILAVDRLTLACHKRRGRRGRRRQHRPRPRPRLPYFTNQLCRCLQIYLLSVITLIVITSHQNFISKNLTLLTLQIDFDSIKNISL